MSREVQVLITYENLKLKVQLVVVDADCRLNYFDNILNFHVCLQNTQLFFVPANKWCKTDSIDFNVLIFDQEKSKENDHIKGVSTDRNDASVYGNLLI